MKFEEFGKAMNNSEIARTEIMKWISGLYNHEDSDIAFNKVAYDSKTALSNVPWKKEFMEKAIKEYKDAQEALSLITLIESMELLIWEIEEWYRSDHLHRGMFIGTIADFKLYAKKHNLDDDIIKTYIDYKLNPEGDDDD